MIPKIIHYCWFGGNEKSEKISQTLDVWKKKLPDFKFMEWTEKEFDPNMMEYTKQAYISGKMAFVSDVARIYALYNHGGVYLDIDIEIKADFTSRLEGKRMVLGFENYGKHIMTAFIGSEKKNIICKDLLEYYSRQFFLDSNGSMNLKPNTEILTNYFKERGLLCNNKFQVIEKDIFIYPEIFFSAYNLKYMKDISNEMTYTVHHCNASWMPKKIRIRFFIKRMIINFIGSDCYRNVYLLIRRNKK